MHKLDWQVLEALYRAEQQKVSLQCLIDIDIHTMGEELFHPGWGGKLKRNQASLFHFAPVVSLSLGRLQKAGFCKGKKASAYDTTEWFLTPKGKKAVRGIVGEP